VLSPRFLERLWQLGGAAPDGRRWRHHRAGLWADTPGEREFVRRVDTIKNALRRGLGLAALSHHRSAPSRWVSSRPPAHTREPALTRCCSCARDPRARADGDARGAGAVHRVCRRCCCSRCSLRRCLVNKARVAWLVSPRRGCAGCAGRGCSYGHCTGQAGVGRACASVLVMMCIGSISVL
jgi:hypothetical protein